MNTKLTLTIEEKVVANAKIYARKRNRSLSNLFENYLKSLMESQNDIPTEISPNVKSMKGAFKMPNDFDYQKELTEILSKKHL